MFCAKAQNIQAFHVGQALQEVATYTAYSGGNNTKQKGAESCVLGNLRALRSSAAFASSLLINYITHEPPTNGDTWTSSAPILFYPYQCPYPVLVEH